MKCIEERLVPLPDEWRRLLDEQVGQLREEEWELRVYQTPAGSTPCLDELERLLGDGNKKVSGETWYALGALVRFSNVNPAHVDQIGGGWKSISPPSRQKGAEPYYEFGCGKSKQARIYAIKADDRERRTLVLCVAEYKKNMKGDGARQPLGILKQLRAK